MADVITLMDIDDDNDTRRSLKSNKGKDVVVSTAPPDTKATPWVEKYRPQSLDDVAAHRDIVETIDRLASGNRLPHLLLYGPPGTGKTSTILAMARKLYGNQMHNMVLELNASDDRGIDVVRQQIQDFASTQSISFGAKSAVKLVLLDEADAMTKDAQFALRRVIEKYTKSTRFALICNNVNKVIPALQSRCTRFRFAPLDAVHVAERLKHVINAEGLDVPDNGLKALVRLSNGDMRKALNILQSTHMASQQITEEAVYLCTGNPLPREIEQIAHWLLNESFATGYKRISEIKTRKGLALVDIVREVTMIKMPADVRIQLINDMADIDAKSAVKLVLLDEADAMTKDAQFALRRVIEKYTKSTRFALICNNVNKVIPALQSRCTRFRFAPLDAVHVAERLKHVINAEGLDVPDNGLKALVRLSNGDMRKALNILQSTHMASQQITEEAVYLCTGNPLPREIEQIAHWLLNESFATGYKRISEIKTRKGLALVDIVREVTMFVFRIKMPADVRIQLINDMADIEYRLSLACNDKLQLGSLIAAFTKARVALVAAVK